MSLDRVPELNLRALHPEEPAAVLRGWAQGLAADLLDAESPSSEEPKSLERLGPYLRGWAPGSRDQAWVFQPLRIVDRRKDLRSLVARIIAGHLRRSDPARRFWKRLWGRRFGPRRIVMPAHMWPVITETAWHEPRFERWLAAAICEHFRRRYLVPAGRLPRPVIRPETWWLLLDLTAMPALRRPPRRWWSRVLSRWIPAPVRSWGYARSRRGRLERRLSAVARHQFLSTPGWAGFWEQWLIGEACRRHRDRVGQASLRARQVLGLLPYLESPRLREVHAKLTEHLLPEGKAEEARKYLVDPGWRSRMPSWLDYNPSPSEVSI